MDVKSEVSYRMNGAARYKFELTLLNAKVTHEGQFTAKNISAPVRDWRNAAI